VTLLTKETVSSLHEAGEVAYDGGGEEERLTMSMGSPPE
jgi:hypothetical protein